LQLPVGRAVVALAGDPAVLERSGQLFSSWELRREYQFTDTDGRPPDWGASKIDFSKHPEQLLQQLRTGSEIQLRWLSELRRKTKHFLTQLPQTKTKAIRGTRTGVWTKSKTYPARRSSGEAHGTNRSAVYLAECRCLPRAECLSGT